MNLKPMKTFAKWAAWLQTNHADPLLVVGAGPADNPEKCAKIVIKSELLREQTVVILRAALAACQEPRRCVACGCTEERACPGGCSWMLQFKHANAGVCSQCWDEFFWEVEKAEVGLR